MTGVFGSEYASAYDALYADKDYAAEAAMLDRLFHVYGNRQTRTVLDLGSGTGEHARHLAALGYDVLGVDASTEMVDRASRKRSPTRGNWGQTPNAGDRGLTPIRAPRFAVGDLREYRTVERFDAVVMMFAVLGYQTGNADVSAALETARRHLVSGGLLAFDVWFGPAVLRNPPTPRLKRRAAGDETLLRFATPSLDTRTHTCVVTYDLWRLAKATLVSTAVEQHTVRFFFPMELELFLSGAGFALRRLGQFPDFEQDPDDSSWSVLAVATAI
jgi:SAM-dependent methyltransferase